MKNTLAKTIGGAALAILLLAISAQIWVSAQDISSEQTETQKQAKIQKSDDFFDDSDARSLEGSWSATVTFRNCQTGAALGPAFPSMNTFMQGGTMQEFGVASGFLRGPGHGVWKHDAGRFFLNTFQFFRFNPDNTPNGRVVARRQIELLSDFEYTATNRNEFYNNAGNLVGQGCATETGTRFQ